MRNHFSTVSQSIRTPLAPIVRSLTSRSGSTTVKYTGVEGLGQPHADSLVVASDSVSSDESG